MKALNLLNPQKWIGQIAVLLVFFMAGGYAGVYVYKKQFPCGPTTQVNVAQKIKAKKNSEVTSSFNQEIDNGCHEWLKGLSNKQIRDIKRAH